MKLKYVIGILGVLLPFQAQGFNPFLPSNQAQKMKKKPYLRSPLKNFSKDRLSGYLNRTFRSAYDIGKNVFTLDSMKVLVPSIPLYLSFRQADSSIHRQFYTRDTHTNRNQPGRFLNWVSDDGIGVLYGGFILNGFFNKKLAERAEFQLYTTGLVLTFTVKSLLKYIKMDANVRPWNENFDGVNCTYGGNPSGHTATMVYTTVFFGLSRGIKWALPLSLYTSYTMAMMVTENRHYASQVVVGSALGGLVGSAAYRLFRDIKMPKDMSTGLGRDLKGNLALSLAYDF